MKNFFKQLVNKCLFITRVWELSGQDRFVVFKHFVELSDSVLEDGEEVGEAEVGDLVHVGVDVHPTTRAILGAAVGNGTSSASCPACRRSRATPSSSRRSWTRPRWTLASSWCRVTCSTWNMWGNCLSSSWRSIRTDPTYFWTPQQFWLAASWLITNSIVMCSSSCWTETSCGTWRGLPSWHTGPWRQSCPCPSPWRWTWWRWRIRTRTCSITAAEAAGTTCTPTESRKK